MKPRNVICNPFPHEPPNRKYSKKKKKGKGFADAKPFPFNNVIEKLNIKNRKKLTTFDLQK